MMGSEIPGVSPPLDRRPRRILARTGRLVDWHKPFGQVLDYAKPPFAKWFVGGETNLCHNAVDRHLKDRANQPALIYISTETGEQKTYTYAELHAEVQRMAAVLQSSASARATAC
jgi:propionyl-CoA synthetase